MSSTPTLNKIVCHNFMKRDYVATIKGFKFRTFDPDKTKII